MFKHLLYIYLASLSIVNAFLAQNANASTDLPPCCATSAPATLPICCIPSIPGHLPTCCTASSTTQSTATPTPTPAPKATPTPSPTPIVTHVTIDESDFLKIDDSPIYIDTRCISVNQYCAFLNAVASTADPDNLYKVQMGIVPPTLPPSSTDQEKSIELQNSLAPLSQDISCITRSVVDNHFTYSVMQRTRTMKMRSDANGTPAEVPVGDVPITYISLLDAVRFCNWMYHGQPVAPEGPDTTESGAYIINRPLNPYTHVANASNESISWNPASPWRLPTQEQWNTFKATGIDHDYDYDQWIDSRDVNPYNLKGSYMSLGYLQAGYFSPTGIATQSNKPVFRLPETLTVNCGFRLVRIGEKQP